ncbi:glycosyltransferase family 4 protein [Algibacter pacificus]|uniref:glycosyltransferase family 4 protein n=1 Tax=Algibacter pacificus TaxID=2599389 RepID=UPI0011C9B084|nr:glycosyltransferase family 4 protein [Algibacter pacificus]
MKILMVAIPNHHFFQWINQLKNSGYHVYWFDVTDGGPKSKKIKWVTQIKGWKLRWDFPWRSSIKKNTPKLYKSIQRFNENSVLSTFEKTLNEIKPDVVHVFEMQLAGLPILPIMLKNKTPLIYSSWGSDMFNYKALGVGEIEVKTFLARVNYLITDCKRDYKIAIQNGFNSSFLGVFPGNGGIDINQSNIEISETRNTILIKGYDDGVGKASIVLKALELVDQVLLTSKKIIIYSADRGLKLQIDQSKFLLNLNIKIYYRTDFIPNRNLLALMGASCIHIANSISDGMPNALLEAMGMGAFPIQSNPGGVGDEVIEHNKNGLLIDNPIDEKVIAKLIEQALKNEKLRKEAQNFNVNFINSNYNRSKLLPQIVKLYKNIKAEPFK